VNTCPVDAPLRTYDVAAINHDIVYNAKSGEHDPAGAMYVLAADEAAVRAGTKPAEPLFLRANRGRLPAGHADEQAPGGRPAGAHRRRAAPGGRAVPEGQPRLPAPGDDRP
jgi:hypothetical protein